MPLQRLFLRAGTTKRRVVIAAVAAAMSVAAATARVSCQFGELPWDDMLWFFHSDTTLPPAETFHLFISRQSTEALTEFAVGFKWPDDKWGQEFHRWGCHNPMRIAVMHNRLDMVKLLHAHGCEMAQHNNDGEPSSLLEYALERGHVDVAAWLVDGGHQKSMGPRDADALYLRTAKLGGPPSTLMFLSDRRWCSPNAYYAAAVQRSMTGGATEDTVLRALKEKGI